MEPFFTIVVPTYNRAHLIEKTIASLLAQSYQHFEVIVVDDGSTDNTESVVQNISNPKLTYRKKVNAERAAARNFGAKQAKGNYVNFFDSDDIALPNHLLAAANLLNNKGNMEWFHLGYAWAYPDGTVFKHVNSYRGETLNHYMNKGNPLSCNGVFIRKDIIQQFPFNEDRALSASEDYELWCRLTARFPLYYSNEITSLVIDHEARSVRTIHGDMLVKRLELFTAYLAKDEKTLQYYGSTFNQIKMDANSYIALHLALDPKGKRKSIRYLGKAFSNSFSLLYTKRFYATLKHILIKW